MQKILTKLCSVMRVRELLTVSRSLTRTSSASGFTVSCVASPNVNRRNGPQNDHNVIIPGVYQGKYSSQLKCTPATSRQTKRSWMNSSVASNQNQTRNGLDRGTSPLSLQQDASDHHQESVVERLRKIENSMRFRGYSTLRIGIAVSIVIGGGVYVLRDPIRDNVAVEVSQVASRSLEHEDVVGKAEEFAKSLLHTILHDDNIHRLAVKFIKQVLSSEDSRKASLEYISDILGDSQTRQLLANTIRQVLHLAVHDQDTMTLLKTAVVFILSDPESQRAAKEFIMNVLRHEDLKSVASQFFAEVINSHTVVNQATRLGKNVTHSVITDQTLKEETGKTLWAAVKYSITPSWLAGSPHTREDTVPSVSSLSAGSEQATSSSNPSPPTSSQTSQLLPPSKESSPPDPVLPCSPSAARLQPSPSDNTQSLSSPHPPQATAERLAQDQGETGNNVDMSSEEQSVDEDSHIMT